MTVSVVIPSYNYGRFVADAVESALNQTIRPKEVIVVDDGSTDDTADRLKPFGDRILYHYQPNSGLCAARNKGVALSSGDLIALLDADDWWVSTKLERQVDFLQTRPSVGLVGTLSFSDPTVTKGAGGGGATPLPLKSHLTRTRFCPSSAVLRKSVWEAVGGFDPETGGTSDRDYWIRCAALTSVVRLEDPLTFYRIHSGSMTTTKVDSMVASEQYVIDKAFSSLAQLRTRRLLYRRAKGMAALSAAYTLWRDGNRPKEAMRSFLRSFAYWPIPLPPSDTAAPLYRLRFGLRLALAGARK